MENNYGDYKDYSEVVKEQKKKKSWTQINFVLCISLTICLIIGTLGFRWFLNTLDGLKNNDNVPAEGDIMLIGVVALVFAVYLVLFSPFLIMYLAGYIGCFLLLISSIICFIVHRKKEIIEKKDLINIIYSSVLCLIVAIIYIF